MQKFSTIKIQPKFSSDLRNHANICKASSESRINTVILIFNLKLNEE